MLAITIVAIVAVNSIEFSDAASARFLQNIHTSSAVVPGLADGEGVLPEVTSLEESASKLRSKLRQIETGLLEVGQEPGKPVSVKQVYAQMFISWAVWVVLAVAVYFICYRRQSPLPEMTVKEVPDDIGQRLEKLLTTGHWQCMEDSNICIYSFFCPSLRWADTTSLAGHTFKSISSHLDARLSFWAAFATFCGVSLVNVASSGAICGLFTSLLILYFRHQLRDKLGVDSWTCATCFWDFWYVCCCPCCAIAQEARIVKEAMESGYELFTSPTIESAPEA